MGGFQPAGVVDSDEDDRMFIIACEFAPVPILSCGIFIEAKGFAPSFHEFSRPFEMGDK
jgi:hypothetical protein